jgi:hypothetical protein
MKSFFEIALVPIPSARHLRISFSRAVRTTVSPPARVTGESGSDFSCVSLGSGRGVSAGGATPVPSRSTWTRVLRAGW